MLSHRPHKRWSKSPSGESSHCLPVQGHSELFLWLALKHIKTRSRLSSHYFLRFTLIITTFTLVHTNDHSQFRNILCFVQILNEVQVICYNSLTTFAVTVHTAQAASLQTWYREVAHIAKVQWYLTPGLLILKSKPLE